VLFLRRHSPIRINDTTRLATKAHDCLKDVTDFPSEECTIKCRNYTPVELRNKLANTFRHQYIIHPTILVGALQTSYLSSELIGADILGGCQASVPHLDNSRLLHEVSSG
jgi:hypothetical protein